MCTCICVLEGVCACALARLPACQVWSGACPTNKSPAALPFDFPHLVFATATCLTGHLSYLRSCQKAEKNWEDFKSRTEPAFSRIILRDTFILYPKRQMVDFFFSLWNGSNKEPSDLQYFKSLKLSAAAALSGAHSQFQRVKWAIQA